MRSQVHAPTARAAAAGVLLTGAQHKHHSAARRLLTIVHAAAAVDQPGPSSRGRSSTRLQRKGGLRSSPASFVAPAPGVPLRAGLRQLGGNPDSLQGWLVLHGGQQVGTVTKVLQTNPQDAAANTHLLQVERAATLEPYGYQGREVYHIPLVADIVPTLDITSAALHVTPPQGLLEMGRRQLVLNFLKGELQQYATPVDAPQADDGTPLELIRWMPTRKQLEDAGRHDLVSLITQVASFSEVALLLGMRSKRRPNGYWEAIENLDRELSSFILSSWVQLPHPDSPADMYYYNLATRRTSWTAPKHLPSSMLEGGGDGLSSRQDRPVDRVLPTRSTIQAAGRWDLHQAIYYHGGYKAVAEQLKRRPVWPAAPTITRPRQLRQQLLEAAAELGLPEGHMPSMKALRELDREDAAQAIVRMGGVGAVSHQLKLRGARGNVLTLPQLADELRRFMATTAQGTPSATSRKAKDAKSRLPTHRQLHQAKRCDLLHALQVHGHARVSEYMGLQPRKQGAIKGVLTWEGVQAALLAGYTGVRQIAQHLAEQQQQLQKDKAADGTAPAAVPTTAAVTRIWLHRRLAQWVAEGKVQRVRRGMYQLLKQ